MLSLVCVVGESTTHVKLTSSGGVVEERKELKLVSKSRADGISVKRGQV